MQSKKLDKLKIKTFLKTAWTEICEKLDPDHKHLSELRTRTQGYVAKKWFLHYFGDCFLTSDTRFPESARLLISLAETHNAIRLGMNRYVGKLKLEPSTKELIVDLLNISQFNKLILTCLLRLYDPLPPKRPRKLAMSLTQVNKIQSSNFQRKQRLLREEAEKSITPFDLAKVIEQLKNKDL